MGVVWSDAADNHGIRHEDAVNAILNYIEHVERFDESLLSGGIRPDLWIGPTRTRQIILEVMGNVTPPNTLFIFHVMEARAKTLERVKKITEERNKS